ncbi:HNH endonuclease [Sphingomonas sp.]|uniref:HNH endonuclease n=1 Tax=Sphingomonas sp. TaxID=28214 RepID=UPI00258119E9|nr:HNH endonuclease [Sphingomonas sp.]
MIELTVVGANRPALIDDDMAALIGYRWRLDRDGYVMRKSAGKRIYLHHLALPGCRPLGMVRDHVNRDRFDNRRANLRWLSAADNARNCEPARKNPTGFRGVRFEPSTGRFLARLQSGGKALVSAWFDDAAAANDFLIDARRRLMPASFEPSRG